MQDVYKSKSELSQQAESTTMSSILTIGAVIAAVIYFGLQLLIHITHHSREPCITEKNLPFLDELIGILKHRATYLSNLGYATEI